MIKKTVCLTNKQKVENFLRTHPTEQYCCACLTQLTSITNKTQVSLKCQFLAAENRIVQNYGLCSCCGKERKCNQISSGFCIYRTGNTIIVPSVQDSNAFWADLQATIQAAIDDGQKPEEIVFLGGGTIPIPDWFHDWCRSQGIKITILDPVAEIETSPLGD